MGKSNSLAADQFMQGQGRGSLITPLSFRGIDFMGAEPTWPSDSVMKIENDANSENKGLPELAWPCLGQKTLKGDP